MIAAQSDPPSRDAPARPGRMAKTTVRPHRRSERDRHIARRARARAWSISAARAPCSPCRCAKTRRCSAHLRLPPGGPAVHRQADRAAAEFRGAGGDRDGERAADHRDARGLGAADRDRRGAAGHQFLARRPRAGVRRDAGKGACACATPLTAACSSTTARTCMPSRRTACRTQFADILRQGVPCCRLTGEPGLIEGEPFVHIADSRKSTIRFFAARPSSARHPHGAVCAAAQGRRTPGPDFRRPPGGAAVHRQSRSRCCRISRRRRSSRWRTRG